MHVFALAWYSHLVWKLKLLRMRIEVDEKLISVGLETREKWSFKHSCSKNQRYLATVTKEKKMIVYIQLFLYLQK